MIYYGGNAQLLLQRMTQSRVAPAPAAFKMKFIELEISDTHEYAKNKTIDNSSPLSKKSGASDEAWKATLTVPFDLNDMGQWLTLLWGLPVTTDTGPYTHTFTCSLADRPFALLDLGYSDATKFRRWYDVVLNTMSFGVIEGEPVVKLELVPGVEVTNPRPGAAFDAAPTSYADNPVCKKSGHVYDVDGASTLGRISAGNVTFSNAFTSMHCADGQAGFGAHLVGDPMISGSLSGLFESDSSLLDYQEDHTSTPLVMVNKNDAEDHSLTMNLSNVEYGKAKHSIKGKGGIVLDGVPWNAHAGGAASTLVLVNGVSSYV